MDADDAIVAGTPKAMKVAVIDASTIPNIAGIPTGIMSDKL